MRAITGQYRLVGATYQNIHPPPSEKHLIEREIDSKTLPVHQNENKSHRPSPSVGEGSKSRSDTSIRFRRQLKSWKLLRSDYIKNRCKFKFYPWLGLSYAFSSTLMHSHLLSYTFTDPHLLSESLKGRHLC